MRLPVIARNAAAIVSNFSTLQISALKPNIRSSFINSTVAPPLTDTETRMYCDEYYGKMLDPASVIEGIQLMERGSQTFDYVENVFAPHHFPIWIKTRQ